MGFSVLFNADLVATKADTTYVDSQVAILAASITTGSTSVVSTEATVEAATRLIQTQQIVAQLVIGNQL